MIHFITKFKSGDYAYTGRFIPYGGSVAYELVDDRGRYAWTMDPPAKNSHKQPYLF